MSNAGPTKRRDTGVVLPLHTASVVVVLVTLMTASLLLLGHGAAPWVELLYRLLTDGVLLLVWLAGAFGLGWPLVSYLSRSGELSSETGLGIVESIAAGMGVVSLLVLLTGMAGVLSGVIAWALIATGVVATTYRLVTWDRRVARNAPPRFDATLLLLAPVAAMLVVAALTPPGVLWQDEPHSYDVLSYHLQLPREWLELGRVAPLTHNVFSFFPLNVEMHYLLAMHLRGEAFAGMYLAQLMHATMALLLPLVIYFALRPRGKAVASAGAVLVGTSPWLLLLGGVAYNEAGLLLFATLSVVFAMRAVTEEGTRGEMVLAGLFAGLACGAKLTAVPTVLLALPVAMAISRVVSRRDTPGSVEAEPRRRLLRDIVAFLLAAVLVLSPWLARNVAWTGNPVFPELTSLFGRAHFTPQQSDRWRAAHAPRDDQRGLVPRLRAFVEQTTVDWRGGHVLGGLMVVGIVVGFARRTRESVMLATMLLMLLLFWLGFTHLQGRFLVLGLPLAALLLGALPTGWSYGSILVACASLVLGIVHAGPQLARSAGVLGLSDLTPLLRASLPDERLVDRLVELDRPVILVGDARAFLYPIPISRLRYRTVFDVAGDDLLRGYHVAENRQAILLIDPTELRRLSRTYQRFPRMPEDWMTRRDLFVIEP